MRRRLINGRYNALFLDYRHDNNPAVLCGSAGRNKGYTGVQRLLAFRNDDTRHVCLFAGMAVNYGGMGGNAGDDVKR